MWEEWSSERRWEEGRGETEKKGEVYREKMERIETGGGRRG